MVVFSVISDLCPSPGQTVASASPGPTAAHKSPEGKATDQTTKPAGTTASLSAVVVERQVDAPSMQRAKRTSNLGGSSPSKELIHEAEHISRGTRSARLHRAVVMVRAWKMARLQGRVRKHQGGRRKARKCIEEVAMAMQGVDHTYLAETAQDGNLEPPAKSGSSLAVPGVLVQIEAENIQQVVAAVARIRRREAVEGATTNPP